MLNRTGIEIPAVYWTLFSYFQYHWGFVPVFGCCCIHRVTAKNSNVLCCMVYLWNFTSRICSFCRSDPWILYIGHFHSFLSSSIACRQCLHWLYFGMALGLISSATRIPPWGSHLEDQYCHLPVVRPKAHADVQLLLLPQRDQHHF